MKRLIDFHLIRWKNSLFRKPLILRGARQVGKTFAVQNFGKSFSHFVEINLEKRDDLHEVFKKNLDPLRIIRELSIAFNTPIIPGQTLLFVDEIQAFPRAITSLRYFYEEIPDLHVIAAGSLLDFALEEVGMPVGRVESLYTYPLSFIEFLAALQKEKLIEEIITHDPTQEMAALLHADALGFVGEYMALGGMPSIVEMWSTLKDPLQAAKDHSTILDTYRQDFAEYTKQIQIKYIKSVFSEIPRQLGRKFKYSDIDGDFRKRELAPALDLLVTAGIAHKVYYASGHKIPSGAQVDPLDYKVIFLDVGLAQAELGFSIANWLIHPIKEFSNKGGLTEAFIGQEILSYNLPYARPNLYYWHSKARANLAEIDYLLERENNVIPIEVKGGTTGRLKSLHEFFAKHQEAPYGLRISAQNYSVHEKIHSYPLYALFKVMRDDQSLLLNSIESLL